MALTIASFAFWNAFGVSLDQTSFIFGQRGLTEVEVAAVADFRFFFGGSTNSGTNFSIAFETLTRDLVSKTVHCYQPVCFFIGRKAKRFQNSLLQLGWVFILSWVGFDDVTGKSSCPCVQLRNHVIELVHLCSHILRAEQGFGLCEPEFGLFVPEGRQFHCLHHRYGNGS